MIVPSGDTRIWAWMMVTAGSRLSGMLRIARGAENRHRGLRTSAAVCAVERPGGRSGFRPCPDGVKMYMRNSIYAYARSVFAEP